MSDLRSRVLGTIFGTLSRGTFPQRNPVAFLYGPDKVRLPDIFTVYTPELQKSHPYAYIIIDINGGYRLILQETFLESHFSVYGDATSELHVWENYDPSWVEWRAENGHGTNPTRETYIQEGEIWRFVASRSYTADMYPTQKLSSYVWTNRDIVRDNIGPVDLAASDPVPVYE